MPERARQPLRNEFSTEAEWARACGEVGSHNTCLDAFTAWLSKAAQGLLEPVGYIQDRPGQHLVLKRFLDADNFPEFWDAVIRLDTVQPLVAQLRAENERLAMDLCEARGHHEFLDKQNDALRAEVERLKGIQPDFPPRPPEGEGLPRYGLRWNGPQQPLATPMDDGYWTPWHLAEALLASAGGGDAQ